MKKINIKGIISLIPPWVLLLIVDILIGYFIVDMTYLYTVYSTIKKILFTIFIVLPISICTLFLILLTYILFVVWFKEKIKGGESIAQLFLISSFILYDEKIIGFPLAFHLFLSILWLALPETVGNFWCRNAAKS